MIVGSLGFTAALALCWCGGVGLDSLSQAEEPVRGSLLASRLADPLVNVLYGSFGAAACLLPMAIALAMVAWGCDPGGREHR